MAPGASTIGVGMTTSEQWKIVRDWAIVMVAAVLIFGGMFAAMLYKDHGAHRARRDSPMMAGYGPVDQKLDTRLITTAQEGVLGQLKTPATAEFPGVLLGRDQYRVSPEAGKAKNGLYVVRGVVDAQNSHGAMIRSSWSADIDATRPEQPAVIRVTVD